MLLAPPSAERRRRLLAPDGGSECQPPVESSERANLPPSSPNPCTQQGFRSAGEHMASLCEPPPHRGPQ